MNKSELQLLRMVLDGIKGRINYAKNFAPHKVGYYEQVLKEFKEQHPEVN